MRHINDDLTVFNNNNSINPVTWCGDDAFSHALSCVNFNRMALPYTEVNDYNLSLTVFFYNILGNASGTPGLGLHQISGGLAAIWMDEAIVALLDYC